MNRIHIVGVSTRSTRGGPWFDEWQNVAYADLWKAKRDSLTR